MMRIIQWKHILILFGLLFTFLPAFSQAMPEAVEEEKEVYPVTLYWGIPDDVDMDHFEGLQREVEGEEVIIDNDDLQLTMETGKSYILPIFAFSEDELEGIRYSGENIPMHVSLEWMEPWNRVWYDFEDIPEEFVISQVTEENGEFHVDFGPPEGALFADQIPRYIWFRMTPEETGEYELTIHGYDPEDGEQVTNTLTCSITVTD